MTYQGFVYSYYVGINFMSYNAILSALTFINNIFYPPKY